ncbi:hypothetical protein DENSPDRAFT_608203 [Dentipellis sp. KUC8613]|nr:hypothetical protein DENSPDRAFT_608203 [Dentipellis sp. KUC8613]
MPLSSGFPPSSRFKVSRNFRLRSHIFTSSVPAFPFFNSHIPFVVVVGFSVIGHPVSSEVTVWTRGRVARRK